MRPSPARGVLQLATDGGRRQIGEPDGQPLAAGSASGDGAARQLDGPRQRERREHDSGFGEVLATAELPGAGGEEVVGDGPLAGLRRAELEGRSNDRGSARR